jgi:predicted nuclease with TOPRIM domain
LHRCTNQQLITNIGDVYNILKRIDKRFTQLNEKLQNINERVTKLEEKKVKTLVNTYEENLETQLLTTHT